MIQKHIPGKGREFLRLHEVLGEAFDVLKARTESLNTEMQTRQSLRRWLSELPQEANIALKTTNGDEELNSWTLVATDPETQREFDFDLDRFFWVLEEDEVINQLIRSGAEVNFGEVIQRIPPEILNEARRRREVLIKMGFVSSQEVNEWYQKAFHEETVDATSLERAWSEIQKHPQKAKKITRQFPPVIQFLFLNHPDLAEQLVSVLRADQARHLISRRLSNTPPSLLAHLRNLAVQTQHGFLETWLEPLIKEDHTPYISGKDKERREALIAAAEEQAKRAVLELGLEGKPAGSFLPLLVGSQLRAEMDWERAIEALRSSHKLFLSLELRGGKVLSQEEQEFIQKINQLIDEELTPEYAFYLMAKDAAAEVSDEAIKILKILPGVGIAVQLLEMYDVGALAKFLASQSGDTLTEWSEMLTFMQQQGWDAKTFLERLKKRDERAVKLMKRFQVVGPALGVSGVLSAYSHHMIQKFGPHLGGLFFATSAIFGTLTTQLVSIKWFSHNYQSLIKEGKLEAVRPEGIPEQWWFKLMDRLGGLEGLVKELKRVEEGNTPLPAKMSESFQKFLVSVLQEEGVDETTIKEMLNDLDQNQLENYFAQLERISNPALVERLKVGFKEAVAKNPARKSIFLGIATSLALTPNLAPLALKLPLLWAALGDLEVFSSGVYANLFAGRKGAERFLRKVVEGKH